MKSDFSLVPFVANNASLVQISGMIERLGNLLTITYKLTDASKIVSLDPHSNPTRQFDLWEHTCFEFFLGLKNSSQYWEFNLSLAGHWNIFHFLKYRENIAEEMAFSSLPFRVSQQNDILELHLEVNLQPIILPHQSLDVGITAVIEDRNHQLSYWALTHPAQAADFHQRDSFLISI